MGKTIRRKNETRREGYYEWKDEVRNRAGAADAYFHSDMLNRGGRGADIHKGVKDHANSIRRCEFRVVKGRLKKQDAEEVLTFNNDVKAKNESNKFYMFC